jgi:hypothetical protein
MNLESEIQVFIAQCQNHLQPGYWKAPIGEQRRLYGELCRAYDFGRPSRRARQP